MSHTLTPRKTFTPNRAPHYLKPTVAQRHRETPPKVNHGFNVIQPRTSPCSSPVLKKSPNMRNHHTFPARRVQLDKSSASQVHSEASPFNNKRSQSRKPAADFSESNHAETREQSNMTEIHPIVSDDGNVQHASHAPIPDAGNLQNGPRGRPTPSLLSKRELNALRGALNPNSELQQEQTAQKMQECLVSLDCERQKLQTQQETLARQQKDLFYKVSWVFETLKRHVDAHSNSPEDAADLLRRIDQYTKDVYSKRDELLGDTDQAVGVWSSLMFQCCEDLARDVTREAISSIKNVEREVRQRLQPAPQPNTEHLERRYEQILKAKDARILYLERGRAAWEQYGTTNRQEVIRLEEELNAKYKEAEMMRHQLQTMEEQQQHHETSKNAKKARAALLRISPEALRRCGDEQETFPFSQPWSIQMKTSAVDGKDTSTKASRHSKVTEANKPSNSESEELNTEIERMNIVLDAAKRKPLPKSEDDGNNSCEGGVNNPALPAAIDNGWETDDDEIVDDAKRNTQQIGQESHRNCARCHHSTESVRDYLEERIVKSGSDDQGWRYDSAPGGW